MQHLSPAAQSAFAWQAGSDGAAHGAAVQAAVMVYVSGELPQQAPPGQSSGPSQPTGLRPVGQVV